MKDKRKLSGRQENILEYIKDTILKKGYPPTIREIGDEVGLNSPSSVHGQLEALEKKGYIKRDFTKPRSIEIIDDCFRLTQREVTNVPVLNTIISPETLCDEENIINYYPIPSELLPNEEIFMLEMYDESMSKTRILKGDQIIVERTSEAEDNDIVVALVNESPIIRRYFKKDSHYRLQADNDTIEPIITDSIEIIGKVIGLFRQGIHPTIQ